MYEIEINFRREQIYYYCATYCFCCFTPLLKEYLRCICVNTKTGISSKRVCDFSNDPLCPPSSIILTFLRGNKQTNWNGYLVRTKASHLKTSRCRTQKQYQLLIYDKKYNTNNIDNTSIRQEI